MPWILLLGCLLLGSPPAAGFPAHATACSAADSEERTAFRKLRSLIAKARRGDPNLSQNRVASLPYLLKQVQALRTSEPEFDAEINLTLFELAALQWSDPQNLSTEAREICESLGSQGFRALEQHLVLTGESAYAWIAESILSSDQGPQEPRLVAAKLLQGKRERSTRQALMFTARTSVLELRQAALEALVGWDDPVVSHFFLESMAEEGHGLQYLTRHFASFNMRLHPRVERPLLELCRKLYRSSEWRDAARAGHLIRCLASPKAVPVLLDALVVWEHRMGSKSGSKRILWEVCGELRQRSGRALKPEPELWQKWWQEVESGAQKLPEQLAEEGIEVSQSGFYGLQALTDRVLFVIDRSGSMLDPIGTDQGTRYEEAVGQFVDYMHASGPETRFSVVLFSDEARVYSRVLRKASSRNVAAARRWLEQNGPEGGTYLHHGLSVALELGPGGQLSPQKVEADTLIVLCDGRTSEGPGWVEPWLRRWNDEAQLVFQCVEIGNSGDGTLEALAGLSGGDYVRVLR